MSLSLSWTRRLWVQARDIAARSGCSMDEAMQKVTKGNLEQLGLLRQIDKRLGFDPQEKENE